MSNRFVLADETGLIYDRTGVKIELLTQDEGRTMVAFLKPSPNAEEEKAEHLRNLADDLGSYRHMIDRFEKGN